MIFQAEARVSFCSDNLPLCSPHLIYDEEALKGQLISKWYLQFSQKTNKKIQLYYYGTSSQIVFVQFLGELNFICSEKATKFCEIFTLLLTVCTVRFRKILWLSQII